MHSGPIDTFRAERPIRSRSEDLLGRRSFSDALARAISRWQTNESLVVGLYGPWGSGKSSIKNMILEALAETSPTMRVVDFNPWHFADSRQLLESFFRDLSRAVSRSPFRSGEDRRVAVKRLEKYRSYLKLGQTVGVGFRAVGIALLALPIVQSTLAALGVAYTWLLSIPAAIAGLLFLLSPSLWDALLAALVAREEARAQTLEEAKRDIADSLRRLDSALLVVIDDIDRLARQEIFAVFQLVKVNADFPKLIYLLLFDREPVEFAVAGPAPASGRDFVEKIVQVGFTVPAIAGEQLDNALLQGLHHITEREHGLSIGDDPRFSLLFLYARRYLYSLRRVYRLLSSLSLHIGLFVQNGLLSVNFADFLTIEVLRLYEPDLYDAILRNKNRLFGQDFDIPQTDNADRLGALLVSVPEARRPNARNILEELFPIAAAGATYNERRAGEWRQASRICADDAFDRYFQFTLGREDLSAGDIQRLLQAAANSLEALERELRALEALGHLHAAVRALEAHKDELPVPKAAQIVAALFSVSDKFTHVSMLSLRVATDQFAEQVIRGLLNRVPPPRRDEVMSEASHRTTGIYLPLAMADEALSRESVDTPSISPASASLILTQALARLELLTPDDLVNHPHLGFLLGVWRRRGSLDSLREAANRLVQTQHGAIVLLRSLAIRSQGSSGRGRGVQTTYRIDLEALGQIASYSEIDQKLASVDPQTLEPEDRLLLEGFRAGLHRTSGSDSA